VCRNPFTNFERPADPLKGKVGLLPFWFPDPGIGQAARDVRVAQNPEKDIS